MDPIQVSKIALSCRPSQLSAYTRLARAAGCTGEGNPSAFLPGLVIALIHIVLSACWLYCRHMVVFFNDKHTNHNKYKVRVVEGKKAGVGRPGLYQSHDLLGLSGVLGDQLGNPSPRLRHLSRMLRSRLV